MTPEEAQAIVNLRTNGDFVVFMTMVSNLGEDKVMRLVKDKNLECPDYVRGAAAGITEVLESIEKAPKALDGFKNRD